MLQYRLACTLVVLGGLAGTGAQAQEKKSAPWQATVHSTAAQAPHGQDLTRRQIELVRQVNAYFNRLGAVRGSFTQTASNGKRQTGMFHIMRPGRFRFEFARPSRLVVLSDGKQVAVQDYDLKTDDRSDLSQSPFRALLQRDVDLLRDARLSEVSEADGTLMLAFSDARSEAGGSVKLFLATKPTLEVKAWITRDNQGIDTRIDLAEIQTVDTIEDRLFDLSSRLERLRW